MHIFVKKIFGKMASGLIFFGKMSTRESVLRENGSLWKCPSGKCPVLGSRTFSRIQCPERHVLQEKENEQRNNRVIVFGTSRNLELLCRSKTWFLDGTFIRNNKYGKLSKSFSGSDAGPVFGSFERFATLLENWNNAQGKRATLQETVVRKLCSESKWKWHC